MLLATCCVVAVGSDVKLCVCTSAFTSEELRDRLTPTWTAVYQMYPHSVPFRQPVDPVLEQIPVTVVVCVPFLESSFWLQSGFQVHLYSDA